LKKFQQGDIRNESFRQHLIDLMINSVTVWDEPDGFKITTTYNLTSCKTKTFRVSNSTGTDFTGEFGFKESSSTKKSPVIFNDHRGFLSEKQRDLPWLIP
jgi:site-specific DNA recombinase